MLSNMKIISTVPIGDKAIAEIEEQLGSAPEVEVRKVQLKTKRNPYFNQVWLDFKWMRSLFTEETNVRCFAASGKEMRAKKITSHIGMYDLTDRDGVLDFYIGIPVKLDRRAKLNGFKTNVAWLFCHEYIHGKEQIRGFKDRTHAMDDQGRLKELIAEHRKLDEGDEELTFEQEVSFLTQIASMWRAIVGIKKTITQKKTKVNKLYPLVQRRADAIVESMALLGHPVRIVQGYRSMEEQQELYNQGRTTPGNIVTNAKAGESFHNYGVAVDFVFRKEGYNASEELWNTLGAVGKSQGFEWGGDWVKFVDRPHFSMTMGSSLKDFQDGKVDYSIYS
jgi:peptidoglycan L-alanyl-D-glutamate endopeptidase CwlK